MQQFALTPDQLEFVAHVEDVAQHKLTHDPNHEPGRVDRVLVRALGAAGLLRALYGGSAGQPLSGAAAMQLCLLRETLAKTDTAAETALALQGLGSYPILQSGPPAMVERWLPGVVSGDVVASFALSEAGAGSDAARLALRAEADGPGAWRLHGSKTWISNAPNADVYTVFARTGESGAKGVSAFAIAGDSEGLAGSSLDMLSEHALGELRFEGVRVTEADLIGAPGEGFKVAMRTLDLFRPSVGAFAVGMAAAALAATVGWVHERAIYGATLADQQSVQHQLAEMAIRVQASRLMVHAAAAAYDHGAPPAEVTSLAAMAKLYATEEAQYVVDRAVQLHGARGLQRGHLLEHLYRDVRAPRIYEGASEVQRTIIGRHLLKTYRAPNQPTQGVGTR